MIVLSTKPRRPSDRVMDYLRLMPLTAATIAKHSPLRFHAVCGALRQLNMQGKVRPAGFEGREIKWTVL